MDRRVHKNQWKWVCHLQRWRGNTANNWWAQGAGSEEPLVNTAGEPGWRESPAWQFGTPWACETIEVRVFLMGKIGTHHPLDCHGCQVSLLGESHPLDPQLHIRPLLVFVSYPFRPCPAVCCFSPSMRVYPLTLPTVVMDRSIYTEVPWRNQKTRMHMLCHYHLCWDVPFHGHASDCTEVI